MSECDCNWRKKVVLATNEECFGLVFVQSFFKNHSISILFKLNFIKVIQDWQLYRTEQTKKKLWATHWISLYTSSSHNFAFSHDVNVPPVRRACLPVIAGVLPRATLWRAGGRPQRNSDGAPTRADTAAQNLLSPFADLLRRVDSLVLINSGHLAHFLMS